MTMLGIFFLTPFFMERGLHLSPTHVAILLTSQQFYNVLTSYLGGWLHDKPHARWIRPLGMGLICFGFFTLSLTAPVLTFATYMLVAIPIGIGMGTFMSVNNTVIMSAVPRSTWLRLRHVGNHATGWAYVCRPVGERPMTGVAGGALTAQTDPASISWVSGGLHGGGLYRAHSPGLGLCARGPQVASVQARRTGTAGRRPRSLNAARGVVRGCRDCSA